MELTSENVSKVFNDCKSVNIPSDETNNESATVEGVLLIARFDKKALERHRDNIKSMVRQLPTPFRPAKFGGGGGWSFLNMCDDEKGFQWTGFHIVMDQLLCLGLATGLMGYNIRQRDTWGVFYGGMPYVKVNV